MVQAQASFIAMQSAHSNSQTRQGRLKYNSFMFQRSLLRMDNQERQASIHIANFTLQLTMNTQYILYILYILHILYILYIRNAYSVVAQFSSPAAHCRLQSIVQLQCWTSGLLRAIIIQGIISDFTFSILESCNCH